MKIRTAIVAAALGVAAMPVHAETVDSVGGGFASQHAAVVAADRARVWEELLHPQRWWSHTWSNESANLHLDPQAGGCLCETLPAEGDWPAGSVEHMRVVFVQPGRTLRMSGSLGPLQAEGLVGTLTVTLEEVDGGTRIGWTYVTGGQARFDPASLAAVVDGVQAEFLGGLVDRLGGAMQYGRND